MSAILNRNLALSARSLSSFSSSRIVAMSFSSAAKKPEVVLFEEIQARTTKGPQDYVLIDVREPNEVAQGVIPTSHHIPVGNFAEALDLSAEDFEKKYGFKKFDKEQEVIIYCRSGRRSGIAFELAKKAGFQGVRDYRGSWLDYEAKLKAGN